MLGINRVLFCTLTFSLGLCMCFREICFFRSLLGYHIFDQSYITCKKGMRLIYNLVILAGRLPDQCTLLWINDWKSGQQDSEWEILSWWQRIPTGYQCSTKLPPWRSCRISQGFHWNIKLFSYLFLITAYIFWVMCTKALISSVLGWHPINMLIETQSIVCYLSYLTVGWV